MADVIINRSELVGLSKSKTALVECIIRHNALNCTGKINYNAGGVTDGIGFESVTEKFVDNFLLRVLVPDYNVKDGKNIFIGSQNKTIRELLDVHGLEKCTVKAVAFNKVKEPPTNMLDNLPLRDVNKVANNYFYQEFKIACPNLDYATVMDFTRTAGYKGIGFDLKDIDITMDYAGSFEKYELVNHLIDVEGFREEGSHDTGLRTIVNNDSKVGKNCLTFMETIDGFTTRQKIYNKMVQMLECKSVRSSLGCHWKDWVCQTGTRLASARDSAKNRGLTRVEVTFSIDTDIPNDKFIDNTLLGIVRYIPKSLVYSTPFSATWKAYCDTFLHSLVCIDRHEDVGVVAYSYNEVTGNISGQVYEKWSEREKWCLDKLTLNGNLPLDVIDINTFSIITTEKGKKDAILEISGSRYYKIHSDSSIQFTTRLVSKNGVYSSNNATVEENKALLEKAGLLEHENCIPYLAKSRASKMSKADAELRKVDRVDVKIVPRKANENLDVKEKLYEEAKRIDNIRTPLLMEIDRKKMELENTRNYTKQFCTRNSVHLRDLEQGTYIVMAAKQQMTRYGCSYKLLVQLKDGLNVVWSNSQITNTLAAIPTENLQHISDPDSGFLTLYNKPLGILMINGRGTNQYGHTTVYCTFALSELNGESLPQVIKNTKADISNCKQELANCLEEESNELPIVERENLLSYREYQSLTILPLGSLQKVEAIGYIKHYGTLRLVVRIDGQYYQAGDDLEHKVEQLKKGCSIKLEKIRMNPTRYVKYVVCSIWQNGDWTALVDYIKTPILNKFDGGTCIVDVRSKDIKGTKRKLLLTEVGRKN